MTDWKGNEILEGMTIMRVSTKPLFNNIRYGFSFIGENGESSWNQVGEPVHTPDHIWEIQFEAVVVKRKIIMPDGNKKEALFYTPYKEMNYTFEVEFIDMAQPSDIVCIKGISDNEQEYFLQYFNKI